MPLLTEQAASAGHQPDHVVGLPEGQPEAEPLLDGAGPEAAPLFRVHLELLVRVREHPVEVHVRKLGRHSTQLTRRLVHALDGNDAAVVRVKLRTT